jgi:2-polyprenyl-3-methyl-5-hydroxy-6-metoxy-1,4-benzoquinol methylase
LEDPIRRIIRSYDSRVIRAYALCRFAILRQHFLEEIGQYLPKRGRILDLGCGFGLFSLYFASQEPGRVLRGVDIDERRISYARKSAGDLKLVNVSYAIGDVLEWDGEAGFDAIYILDMIHHLPQHAVKGFLEGLRDRLVPGGTLVIKEVAYRPAWKRWFTWALDRLMVGWNEPIRYWPEEELMALVEDLGFEVYRHRLKDILPYPHILYVARLPA